MRRRWSLLALAVALAVSMGVDEAPASTDGPFLDDSPWPQMRRDMRNTAQSSIRGRYRGDRPWKYATDRGIFSTPVIGERDTVYIGSADGGFYAIARGGERLWRFGTEGIIDAAAALGARPRGGGAFPITIGSGDETLYQLSGSDRQLSRGKRVRWTFRTALGPATGQLVNWWEGNVAYGPDSNLYVGNTGGGAYSLTPGGDQRWVTERANSVWTTPAFDAAGNSYWGSVDFYAFSLDPSGAQRWQTFTPGYLTSSPALGSDGSVYIGSFDGSMYALDPSTGAKRWSFPTADHIYSSPALASAPDGSTEAIYVGSADGSVYAISPSGQQLWRYDTGDPVRSSPVVGRAPKGDGKIVYVGSSNGGLYALDAQTGRRRWSFDTTPHDPALSDRNDLNGSPALGRRGVYIGGEHGRVWFVPYDYCREVDSDRCSMDPGQEFNPNVNRVFAVTPGGTTLRGSTERVPPATTLAARLVVRRDGAPLDASFAPGPQVSSKPPFPFTSEVSGDGQYVFIRPDSILKPDTTYRVRISGQWSAPSGDAGAFDKTLRYRTRATERLGPDEPSGGRQVPAIEISRLALPEPSLLPSVNQIGFDSYDLVAGTIEPAASSRGSSLLWVIGASPTGGGELHADPAGGFAFPLFGPHRRNAVALRTSDVSLQFSFGPVPLRSLDFRGSLEADGSFKPGASLYGQVTCADVPNYSTQLRIAGVCNQDDTLASYGTFLSDGYDNGGVNERPQGLRGGAVQLTAPTGSTDGVASTSLRISGQARYRAARHLLSILLVDASTGAPVELDYRSLTTQTVDSKGNVIGARLGIPAGTQLPEKLTAYTIADVFPLNVTALPPRR